MTQRLTELKNGSHKLVESVSTVWGCCSMLGEARQDFKHDQYASKQITRATMSNWQAFLIFLLCASSFPLSSPRHFDGCLTQNTSWGERTMAYIHLHTMAEAWKYSFGCISYLRWLNVQSNFPSFIIQPHKALFQPDSLTTFHLGTTYKHCYAHLPEIR